MAAPLLARRDRDSRDRPPQSPIEYFGAAFSQLTSGFTDNEAKKICDHILSGLGGGAKLPATTEPCASANGVRVGINPPWHFPPKERVMKRLCRPCLVHFAAIVGSVALIGSTAACGGSSASGSSGSSPAGSDKVSKKVDSIAAMVPKSIAQKGTLTIAAATYPPAVIEPADGAAPTGWDIENVRQIAAVLGLKVNIKIAPFDGIIAGLQAGRYDAATGEIYATPERTKTVTFVTNHASADALMVPVGSKITSADTETDLCGHTLAASLGSAEAALAQKLAGKCKSAGKGAITVKTFKSQAEVNLALKGSRVDAAVSSASQVAYVMSQAKNQFELVELPWAPKYKTGFVLARNADTEKFAKAVQAATDHLIESGELQKILDKFNAGQGLIEKAEILSTAADGSTGSN
ncbi:ABC transporter substrate-binding protein [Streptomyces phyllanthi]|uniref:ABC transporter substrate-binding protein n=2 Tax=Streptomyces phyllanthi TaxID=1803180 RepID=A0A5N8VTZ9_9ACTN|nr:ABC transporter substrate-binding protein [Streptomyces phyllanthi]MPY38723.1 ABC transporter substrate-binding protein [Streptomyces phyllanthi]